MSFNVMINTLKYIGKGRPLLSAHKTLFSFIWTEATPNPLAKKVVPGCTVLKGKGTLSFNDPNKTDRSNCLDTVPKQRPSFVDKIFTIDSGVVDEVLLGSDFVSIRVSEQYPQQWDKPQFADSVETIIDSYFNSNGSILVSDFERHKETTHNIDPDKAETIELINKLIDSKVRPHVQTDGGDVEFCDFDSATGIVRLRLLGACASCATSTVTIRFMIKNLLTHYVDEVKDVVDVGNDATLDDDRGWIG